MKEYRKTFQQKKTFIEKINENNELQSVEVDVVTNFIKDEVESSSDAEIYTNDDYDSEKDRVTDLDKMRVISNRIFRNVKQSFLRH